MYVDSYNLKKKSVLVIEIYYYTLHYYNFYNKKCWEIMHNEKFAAKWLLATKSDYYLKIVVVVRKKNASTAYRQLNMRFL